MPRMKNPPPEKTKEEKAVAFKAWYEKNKARVALKNKARGDERKQTTWTCECGKTLSGVTGREGHYNTTLHKKNMVKKESGIEPKPTEPKTETKKVVKEKKGRVLLTEEQKKERAKLSRKKYYEKVSAEKGRKKRVKYTNETREEKAKRISAINRQQYLRRKGGKERSDKGSVRINYPKHIVQPKRESKYANETEEEKTKRMREQYHQAYLRRKERKEKTIKA